MGFDKGDLPLEERYGDWTIKDQIDTMGKLGTNTLRIPTTYAAWVKVPGSRLYFGDHQNYIADITKHVIERWNVHVIIDLLSLPGGVNILQIGEAFGHDAYVQGRL
ncbi:hypothetical protein AC579_7609 [Pseudocercospora musae]|uniref:Glycoside hydrolase family 5 domain-containing protein n=1 Tax=Pseudocercospora musae TaxID=113226 RepID=A0A139IDQ9_9PEZI|nr:hypothetical protein AC579_7609 [Pseudocercospora musae]